MIPWGDFWEPDTTKQKFVKWGTILLVLLLGVSIFLINLGDMVTYEYACKNPIIVEAKQTVKVTQSWFSGTTCYDLYLSYHYDGVDYNDILYRNTQNPNYMFADIDTITVAVAPNDPSIPIIRMFNEGPITFAVVLCLLGLSMLIYGILIDLRFVIGAFIKRTAVEPNGSPTLAQINLQHTRIISEIYSWYSPLLLSSAI